MLVWTSFLIAFSALLPLINPLGSSLVFLGLVGSEPPEVFHSLARRIAINNVIFLAVIELSGSAILNFFGLSLPIVQLSGGLVIAAIGWTTLNSKDSSATDNEKRAAGDEARARSIERLKTKAFYPFTFPVTSGPGTLVATLTLTAHAANKDLTQNVLGHLGIFVAVVVLSLGVYFCYAYAPRLARAIPPTTAHGILRVVAFLLLCIGAQIAWNGLSTLLATLPK